MAIRVALHHVSHYAYDRQVRLSPHVVRLRPAPHCRTKIAAYSLKVSPAEHFLNWQQDPFGNWLARLVFPQPLAREVTVEVDLIADLTTVNPFDFFVEEYAEQVPLHYAPEQHRELRPYLEREPAGPRLAQLVGRLRDDVVRADRRTIDVLVDINQLIQRALRYDIRMEPGVFTPEETLTRGHGSCRDFAWLLVNVLRHLGFAARFVSGYSIQLKADQKPLEGPAGVSEDVTDLHAWAEVFLPGAGFIGFDPTSGLACGEGHIPLACTPDPGSAAAISGAYAWDKQDDDDQIEERFEVSMRVTRIEDRPRPTRPFSDAQWRALLACGDAVERVLVQHDVRLTMGGEPTFVAADEPESDEWNTAAVGPRKQKLADQLLRRLADRFAPGGLLHHGLGKWYPGEPLPRFAYSCYFRKDGEPIWQDRALYARDDAPPGHGATQAKALASALAERLGVDASCVIAGFEDAFSYMWRERRLPANVAPFDSKLEDADERERLRRVFERGLRAEVGFALPLAGHLEDDGTVRFETGRWVLRGERMYLLPGDSPMGFRLPLDALPWRAEQDREPSFERDPMAPRAALPSREQLARVQPAPAAPAAQAPADTAVARGESAQGVVRTALCIEPRDGILHVFMPPFTEVECYLALVAALEDATAALGVQVQIEGYHPPTDHRLQRLQVTPDPGVLEVNVHPARSWRELVDNTAVLYEEARGCKLTSDKFMIDGRHTGTGGGNHITLGGERAEDSPFLRRPDLLRSLTSYWLNHPSLSYLFSGLFVGPTSQAPRMDEARSDSLYELDIAFATLASAQQKGEPPPWLADRLFRHLLVDVTGNTHRTELCIDKLYSPDGPSGRQGLIELRAFEMPPDSKMSCAAQLLVRALLATFWRQPYTRAVVRWGTTLVDRFMLPDFIARDFRDVLAELRQAGFSMDPAWYEPQYEFRFPLLGRVAVDGLELELRQAVEPWHVLGEQPAGSATVRYVDSSVERVQVLVRNMTDPRHVVTCNGRRVPLHPTGAAGEFVAGVRYRAWQPPTALHPTIAVHTPLVFDVIDGWAERAVGGCTYHVSHPGGRAHELFPRNALEAESRRAARFFPFGHNPGRRPAPPKERNPELPLTLDLRRS